MNQSKEIICGYHQPKIITFEKDDMIKLTSILGVTNLKKAFNLPLNTNKDLKLFVFKNEITFGNLEFDEMV